MTSKLKWFLLVVAALVLLFFSGFRLWSHFAASVLSPTPPFETFLTPAEGELVDVTTLRETNEKREYILETTDRLVYIELKPFDGRWRVVKREQLHE